MTLGLNDTQHNYTAIMQSVITLLVTFDFVMLKVIMLNVVMLNVVMLNVVMLNVIMVSLMAPLFQLDLFRRLSDGSIFKLKFTF
jgi:hypothetical protein